MVFVKVRETYDLHTVKNKMTVIGIHTPKPDIIKRNFPGLLMQCKAYRPVSADVRIACASVLPLDPLGVGTAEGDVAPEDIFNPILYKAMSNKGMSQLEARINYLGLSESANIDVAGAGADVDTDTFTSGVNEFNLYYGLLSNAHDWKHANPQAGLEMRGLRPLVFEMNYNIGDVSASGTPTGPGAPPDSGTGKVTVPFSAILGKSKPFPFINCTSFTAPGTNGTDTVAPGFVVGAGNSEKDVPWLKVFCGCIIVPPSRLHELFYRMVVEWTIEFSMIRPLHEIADLNGLANIGNYQHFINYNYSATKEALTGDEETILDEDSCMVSATVPVNKVM